MGKVQSQSPSRPTQSCGKTCVACLCEHILKWHVPLSPRGLGYPFSFTTCGLNERGSGQPLLMELYARARVVLQCGICFVGKKKKSSAEGFHGEAAIEWEHSRLNLNYVLTAILLSLSLYIISHLQCFIPVFCGKLNLMCNLIWVWVRSLRCWFM